MYTKHQQAFSAQKDIKFGHKLVVVGSCTSPHSFKLVCIKTYLQRHAALAHFSSCLPSIPMLFYWL